MTNAKDHSHVASGLYTYVGTQRTTNNLKYLVRVDLDEGTTNFLKFPYLMIKDKKTGKYKKYKNIVIHIDSAKLEGNELNLHGWGTIKGIKGKKGKNITLDGIYYVGENKQQELKLNINWGDIAETVSGNPDKILRNMSIKVSALDKGKGPRPPPSPSPSPGPSKTKMYKCTKTGHCRKSKHGTYKTREECMKSCKGSDPVPGGQPKGGPGWKPIGPTPTPPNPTPPGPSRPNFPIIPGFNPSHSTPADINVQIDKNKINGNSSINNQCPPKYPYAYDTKIQGIGTRCCVGKPMAPNTSGGNYTCDIEGACRGTCAKNSKPCPNPDSSGFCMNNSSITKQNLCPASNPYPMTYYIASMTGERWGGKNHFCCKTDPGPNNDCNPENIAACPQPQCRKNEEAIQGKDMNFVNSVICSQQIDNFRQLNPHNPQLYNKLNSDGFSIDAGKFHLYNTVQYVTYTKMALISKSSPSTEYLLQKTPTNPIKNNKKIILKLRKKLGNRESITVNIDAEFFNYLKGLKAGSSIFITPTSTDMTTCKSNNKPLYAVSSNSYGRDFSWEWQQMGSQTVDPQFVLTNLNMGGSINGKPGPVSGNNNTLNEIINKNSPYIIYKATTSDQLYYYDKTKIPVDCSTPTSCQDTCSGYTDYASKGAIGDRHKYYSMCDKGGGMFCTANNNYMGNIRDCDGKPKDYAVPLPYCSSSQNTNGYGYSFNNGMECSETPYTPTYGILRESSVSALNNSSKPCLNTPCCPLTHKEAYVYNKPNSDKTMRLCYNADHGKEYSCNPVKSDVGSLFPSCSNPYIPNTKYTNMADNIHTYTGLNSVGECKIKCGDNEACGIYQYQSNNGQCDLFPLVTPSELKANNMVTQSNGTTIGMDYKKDWILDRTFDLGNNNYIKLIHPDLVNNNAEGCRNICTLEPKCNGFTFDTNTCTLYNSTPAVPKLHPGAISLRISNPNAFRTMNDYTKNLHSTVAEAKKIVSETFQSAINTVQLNKNIEHMTTTQAQKISQICDTPNITQACQTEINTELGYKPIIEAPQFYPCTESHPIAVNGGTQCCNKILEKGVRVRLPTRSGRGIKICDNGEVKSCTNGNICGNVSTKNTYKYTSNGNTVNSIGKQVPGCFLDNNMVNAGYKTDQTKICGAGEQCVGQSISIKSDGSVKPSRSTYGYCTSEDIQPHTFNQSRVGNVLEKSSQVSPDHCAYACMQNENCRAWNFDPRITDNNCTLLSSAESLIPSGSKESPGVITSLKIPGYSSAGQKECKGNLKHLPNVNDIHYIGDNNNANSLFNTTKTKGSNLIECKDKDCKLTPGTTGPNGFKCVSNPLGWNDDTNAQWWYAKTDDTPTDDWVQGKTCLAASDYPTAAPMPASGYVDSGNAGAECNEACNNGGLLWEWAGYSGNNCYCSSPYLAGTSVPFNTASCVSGSTENECIQNASKVDGVPRSTYNVATCGPGILNVSNLQNTDDNGRCYQPYNDDGLKKAQDICGNNDQCAGVMGVCYGNICAWEPQFSSSKPNSNTKGYTISRHTWVTEHNSSTGGYCAYKD